MRSNFTNISKVTAFFALLAMFSPLLTLEANAQQMMRKTSSGKLSSDQKILHTLNRLGFGARPGDVEKVRSIGLETYIERQLNPDSIPDSEVTAKLGNFEILNMQTSEIFAKYPNGGALIRMLEGNRRNNRRAQNDNQAMESEKDQRTQRQERRRKLIELYQKYDLKPANQIMMQVQSSRILRAAYSEHQLEEAMVDFWANHFNVYSRKAATRWYIPSYERDVIRKHALGNFKDLVVGTAKHPAMLFYLDNFQSVSPNTQQSDRQRKRAQRLLNNPKAKERIISRLKQQGLTDEQIQQRIKQVMNGGNQRNRRGLNENYARELMELHTLGVDGGYTQNDIKEVAKAFTGWTIYDARGYRKAAGNMIKGSEDRQAMRQARQLGISPNTESGTFIFVDRLHDQKPKTVLGQTINEGGMNDGLKVIEILVSHPSTAKFIARKLAVKFVNDKPSDAYVNRIAKAFQRSNGDIKTTLRAMFYDKEFYSPENYRSKIKTPFELLASSLRALDAETNGSIALIGLLNRMGEPLYGYQAPTGYPDTAEDWVNTGALLERMNFAVALASNRIPQTNVNLRQFEVGGEDQILDRAIENILHGEISSTTKSTLMKQMDQPLPAVTLTESDTMTDEANNDAMQDQRPRRRGNNRRARLRQPSGNPEVFKVVGLILGSPEFQRQ
ncbi:MAG: DUF1800 domain-containing protein [Pyrinomonadaceae bacterium]|nr:DUF1800 domain-containing protein [Pyrinomonadaceae bacterium]